MVRDTGVINKEVRVNTDKLTSWLGLAQGVAIAVVDFYATANADGGVNWSSPLFYIGLVVAVLVTVKAYFTNKPSVPSV